MRPTPLCFLALSVLSVAPAPADEPAFTCVVLGASGGLDESDLTSYLLARAGSSDFVAFDAGTLRAAVRRAHWAGALEGIEPPEGDPWTYDAWFLRERVRAYLVSHPHLDHVSGLALNATDDARTKPILGLTPTLDVLRDHVFNGLVWPNFTDEGAEPRLGTYRLVRLEPGAPRPIEGTGLVVEAHPLSHAGSTSTAFLVGLEDGSAQVLYLGDTGPDPIERSDRLAALWDRVAPVVRAGRLRAVFVECSYPDDRPWDRLYGHLTPEWLARELGHLASKVRPAGDSLTALAGLRVVVTHVKPSLQRGPSARERIMAELAKHPLCGATATAPVQATRLEF